MEAKNGADEINEIIENTNSFKEKATFNYNMEIKDMMDVIKNHIEELESVVKNIEIETYKLTGIINEEWRSIDGFANYQVSNIGRVRNAITERILKPGLSGIGYLTVVLCKHGERTTYYIHRLVANEFLENPLDLKCVDHIDHNPKNNCVFNLRFCNHSQNNANSTKRENTSSVYKGVYFNKPKNMWMAYIRKDGWLKNLGYFENEIDGAREYNKHAAEMFGEFKNLNVIPDDETK